jgi:hypothetical protein
VLIASNPPAVNADTHDHGALGPNISDATLVHTPIASTASATGEPCDTGAVSAPSTARAQRKKCAATVSARDRHPEPFRDPPIPLAGEQRFADHLDRVLPASQKHIRQQHMRRQTHLLATTTTTRTQPPLALPRPQHPQPRTTPASQHPHPTTRAHQPTSSEICLDHGTIV